MRPLIASIALMLAFGVAACGPPSVAKVGDVAPPVIGRTLAGDQFDLAAARGRPIIINFWASWCGPCRSEFAALGRALSQYGDQGLVIVGVLYNDSADAARDFVRAVGASWPTVVDTGGVLVRAYRVVGAPQSYFIDRSGVVRSLQIGPWLQQSLDQQMAAILK